MYGSNLLSRGLINWRFDYPKWNFPRPSDNRIESGLYLEQMLIKKKTHTHTLLYLATRTCAFKEQTQLFVALLLRVEIICSVQGYFHWLCWLHLSPVLFCFEWVILLGGNSFWIFFFQLIENSFLFLFFSSNTLFELTRCHCESSAVLECYVWLLICFDL